MERVYVESEAMKWVAYNASSRRLEIGFPDGRIYEYFDVPENVCLELTTSDSVGKYFIANVRKAYRYNQIIGPCDEPKAKPGRKKRPGERPRGNSLRRPR